GVLYSMEKDLTSYSFKEQKKILRDDFDIRADDSDRLYLGLLKNKATNEKDSIWVEESPEVKIGLKFRHLAKAPNGKIYLTELGQTMAKGAKKLFS
ncbi:MAG: hypothetical protein NTW59_05365, partial [Candidatus Diapherotrites archaeon]|nr:hypothetical protein [Candidatus Diapherotrites archaeon]